MNINASEKGAAAAAKQPFLPSLASRACVEYSRGPVEVNLIICVSSFPPFVLNAPLMILIISRRTADGRIDGGAN